MPVPLAVAFYEVVLALHIMAVVVAFGVDVRLPGHLRGRRQADPRALPLVHRASTRIEPAC